MIKFLFPFLMSIISLTSSANPYWDETKVPKIKMPDLDSLKTSPTLAIEELRTDAVQIMRVEIAWNTNETYQVSAVTREPSGTPALVRRSRVPNSLGSYRAMLINRSTREAVAHDAIGTGREYRKLTRALTFRFPIIEGEFDIRLIAENPVTGVMENVLQAPVVVPDQALPPMIGIEVREISQATQEHSLKVVIYSEGYTASRKAAFFQDAESAVKVLKSQKWPGVESMEFQAVFGSSKTTLGNPISLGTPVPERDSFLGLYYPYWDNFGRWNNVVYPTRESKYRGALGQVPYDYPIVLVDNAVYFGVGNFNEITAVPSRHSSFVYLLMHEFGHYFGLNEEYIGGGRTELEFAEKIQDPWSQNMTFEKNLPLVKWADFIKAGTPLPTPSSVWNVAVHGPFGAYRGGYADSKSSSRNHKPGLSCVMEDKENFCPICAEAIRKKIEFDLAVPGDFQFE